MTHHASHLEVLLDIPIDELMLRNDKGLNRRFLPRRAASVAGLSYEVDFPKSPLLAMTYDISRTSEKNIQIVTDLVNNKPKVNRGRRQAQKTQAVCE